MTSSGGLPRVNRIGMGEPFRWLGGAWGDLWRAWPPLLAYGLALAAFSLWISLSFVATGGAFWVFALTCGFVFVAPMLAMGVYEAGALLARGERPTLTRMLFLRRALSADVALLGLALLMIFFFWLQIAQIVYGLSTWVIYRTVESLAAFALTTPEGHRMLIAGSLIGGAIAFLTYALVVVSAPMLLDHRASVFTATITSFRTVATNFGPMIVWALLISVLTLSTLLTGFLGLVIVFPWLGLATWRAYGALVEAPEAAAAAAPDRPSPSSPPPP